MIKGVDYVFEKESLPAISASASKDKTGVVHISLVNIDPNKGQTITINVRGMKATSVTGRILTSTKVQDHNTFDAPTKVQPSEFKGATLKGEDLTVTLPPIAVVVLSIKN